MTKKCVVADFHLVNAVMSGFPSHMISRLRDAYFMNWSRSFSHCFVDSVGSVRPVHR